MMSTPEDYTAWSAAEKLDWLWARVAETAYEENLPTEGPSGFTSAKLLLPPYARTTLTHVGDTLPDGRVKLIHPFGSVARVELKVVDPGPYTGLFAASTAGLVRYSDGGNDGYAPSMALKLPVDGRPSRSLLANPAIAIEAEGEPPHPLSVPLSSENPPPTRAQVRAAEVSFDLAAKSACSRWRAVFQPLEPLAAVTADGQPVTAPRAPHRVDWQPTDAARAACVDTGDWREGFAAIPPGTVLATLSTVAAAGEAPRPWAELIVSTRFIASRWGDERLFFAHHLETDPE